MAPMPHIPLHFMRATILRLLQNDREICAHKILVCLTIATTEEASNIQKMYLSLVLICNFRRPSIAKSKNHIGISVAFNKFFRLGIHAGYRDMGG